MSEVPLKVGPQPGFTPVIGHLVSMLDYARFTTLEMVENLSKEQLDYLTDPGAKNYWKWFHVCEDEISHRGQIRVICRRLPRQAG